MNIIKLIEPKDGNISPKLKGIYSKFNELIDELNSKEFPDNTINSINLDIEELNSASPNMKGMRGHLLKKQTKILRLIEKEHKIVPKNYYRNLSMALGMATFGVPFGVAYGIISGNMAMFGIGLPIGMAIGIAIGSSKDKKAFNEERQLEIDLIK
jgi:hypothetical protein